MGWYGKPDGAAEHIETRKDKWGDAPKKFYLKPCPKCGTEQKKDGGVSLWYVGSGEFGGWRVICPACHHRPDRTCASEEDAVKLWNEGDQI